MLLKCKEIILQLQRVGGGTSGLELPILCTFPPSNQTLPPTRWRGVSICLTTSLSRPHCTPLPPPQLNLLSGLAVGKGS